VANRPWRARLFAAGAQEAARLNASCAALLARSNAAHVSPRAPISADHDCIPACQPVYVDDVAAAIAQILRQSQNPYPVYELAGPRVYSYEELLRTIARIAGLRPVLMRMPFAFWNALAGVAEMLPQPPLTRNQVELMRIDTTASESLPGFRALRISPRSLEDELEAILRQNKPRV
jgi:uncharacterized protein YbjT (DUF2867 family)